MEGDRKEPTRSVKVSKMLMGANYVQKAAFFGRKTGLLGQFADLSQQSSMNLWQRHWVEKYQQEVASTRGEGRGSRPESGS